MTRSRKVIVNFGRALPAHEPIAALMGRMFVLMADLLFEKEGLTGGKMEGLDAFDPMYRQLYFIRANSRTLYSGRHLINQFGSSEKFRAWLAEEPELNRRWEAAKKEVNRAGRTIEKVRNTIGAHAEESIEEGLRSISPQSEAFLEIGADGWMRPQLALHILLATLAPRASTEEWLREVQEDGATLAATIPHFIDAMRVAFALYRKRYPALWP